jgi:hypothetical protein
MKKSARKAILKKEKIYHFDQDMRLMSHQQLAKHFAAKSSGRIMLMGLIKNIIWQAHERIQEGTEPPIEGNIRTFWYLWVKPVLSHIPDDDNVRTKPYKTMLKAFTRMIRDLHLFQYADFDFTDENWENRRIGTKHPEIIVFAEKNGWIRFLKDIHEEFGTTILTLGGAPSVLSSEYTVTHLNQVIDKKKTIKLIGIVDYDPAGEMIAKAFQNQLKAMGLKNSELTTIIKPERYTAKEITMFQFPLPTGQKTKTQKWIQKTNGINGQLFGLESESMPRDRLRKLLRDILRK